MNKLSKRDHPRIIFNAIYLDEVSRSKLKSLYPGRFENYSSDHVTLNFGTNKYPDNLGDKVNILAEGYSCDDKCEVLFVSIGDIKCKNKYPHITISYKNGVNPVYSNELLSKGYEKINSFDLQGVICSFINGKYIDKKIEK